MISVDWTTKVIFVPKTYTQLVTLTPFEIRQLDLNQFRLDLRELEANIFEGSSYLKTHVHNTTVTVGGVTLARVIEIVSGYTVTFEDGSYRVNLVGANSNVADVTNLNQVQIRSANSAGLTFSEEINNQSFLNGRVYVNTSGEGLPGTSFPRGTLTDPSDNWLDSNQIATDRKLRQYDLFGNLVFANDSNLSGTHWWGNGIVTTSVVLGGGNSEGALFEKMQISGTANGRIAIADCLMANLINFSGAARECVISGTTIIDSSNILPIIFRNCMSGVAGVARPIIDANNANCSIVARNYTGGLEIKNLTSGNSVSLDFIAGTLEIDSTCTLGTIVVGGTVEVIDNSGPDCTVVRSRTVTELTASSTSITAGDISAITNAVWNELTTGYNTPNSFAEMILGMQTMIDEMHKLEGLDPTTPVTITPNSKTAGAIQIEVTSDCETFTELQRQ